MRRVPRAGRSETAVTGRAPPAGRRAPPGGRAARGALRTGDDIAATVSLAPARFWAGQLGFGHVDAAGAAGRADVDDDGARPPPPCAPSSARDPSAPAARTAPELHPRARPEGARNRHGNAEHRVR